jgi:hypothetical protein
MRRVFKLSYIKNWGTRFPRKEISVYVCAKDRREVIRKFNRGLRLGRKDCLNVSTEKLPEKVTQLPPYYEIVEIDVLGLHL